jgi:hypothetical protein
MVVVAVVWIMVTVVMEILEHLELSGVQEGLSLQLALEMYNKYSQEHIMHINDLSFLLSYY